MATLFRWLLRLFILSVTLVLLSAVLVYWFASRSLPEYTAEIRTPAVRAPVEIVRDNANVPHVFGGSDDDVYFGLGFAHAQDRLWQMMMMRRTAQGRLSELFGASTLHTDELMRRLDLYSLATASVAAQDDYTKSALTAYSRGVNAWLTEVNKGARGRGAPEFWIFTPQIAPWTPADSIALLKLMALKYSDKIQSEVLRARLSLTIDEGRIPDLLPDAPGTGLVELPEFASLFPGLTRVAGYVSPPESPFSPIPPRGLAGASNAWAAAPSRSAAGGTLLANDPHFSFSAPSIWYLARLELQSGGVIGGTIPGIPAVLVGRSSRLGWGLTAAYVDDQDLFLERVNPANSEEIDSPDGWAKTISRPSIIRIKDRSPETVTLRWSANGPILPGHHFDIGAVTRPGLVASLSWTALTGTDTSMSGFVGIMRSGDIRTAIDAGEQVIAPAMNLTLVDSQDIAMKTIGAIPRRAARHQTLGRLPSPGWRPENRWQGRLNYSSNPEFVSPAGGILGNTNNKTVDRPFPFHVSHDWGDTQRIQRWQRLMQTREVHTRESFIEAQLDTVSVAARTLLALVGKELWFTGEAAPEGSQERLRQNALALLANWNGEMNEHLPEPMIYAAWMRALQQRLIQDELGPLAAEFRHIEPLFIERVFRNTGGAADWCDVLRSAPVETCAEIASLALDDALLWITERYGPALESLRWGDVHEARHDHEILGGVSILEWFVNIRQSTSGGDFTLQRGLTLGTGPDPFVNVHGPGYRGVYDFADPDSSVFIIATGQSGHPLSRYYDDLGERWRRGEYIPMSLDPELARAAAVGVTRILPAAD